MSLKEVCRDPRMEGRISASGASATPRSARAACAAAWLLEPPQGSLRPGPATRRGSGQVQWKQIRHETCSLALASPLPEHRHPLYPGYSGRGWSLTPHSRPLDCRAHGMLLTRRHWVRVHAGREPLQTLSGSRLGPRGSWRWIATHVRPEPSEHPGPTPKRRKRSGAPPAVKLPFPPQDRS